MNEEKQEEDEKSGICKFRNEASGGRPSVVNWRGEKGLPASPCVRVLRVDENACLMWIIN